MTEEDFRDFTFTNGGTLLRGHEPGLLQGDGSGRGGGEGVEGIEYTLTKVNGPKAGELNGNYKAVQKPGD